MVCTGGHLWWYLYFLSFKFSNNASTEGASMPIQEQQRNGPKDGREGKRFVVLLSTNQLFPVLRPLGYYK